MPNSNNILPGNPSHLSFVGNTILAVHPDIKILLSRSNTGNHTYDGVDIGGMRLADEIEEYVELLKKEEETQVNRISIIGYSLGGLISRFSIGALYTRKFFDRVRPIHFATFASPHVGVRLPERTFFAFLSNHIGPWLLSRTGVQLYLSDGNGTTCLLEKMTKPGSNFMLGLAEFKDRTLYANIVNDRSVPYFTAAMTDMDPFADGDLNVLQYESNYPVILHQPLPLALPHRHRKIRDWRSIVFVFFLPVLLVTFLFSSAYQTYHSKRRVNAYKLSKSISTTSKYSDTDEGDPLLSEEMQSLFETMIDRNDDDEAECPDDCSEEEGDHVIEETNRLNLCADQRAIIRNMGSLQWEKVGVHIKNVMHSHAAIIRRINTARYSEGEIVLKHFVDKILV